MIAASKRGLSHAHTGKFRDDDFQIAYLDTGWYILMVADGAGSAQYSRKGSQIACDTALDFLMVQKEGQQHLTALENAAAAYITERNEEHTKHIKNNLYHTLGGAMYAARKAIKAHTDSTGDDWKNYATTFLLSIAKPIQGNWLVGTYWVGDGAVGVYTQGKTQPDILGMPDGGEFSGQTRFLTMSETGNSEDIMRRIQFQVVDNFTALILMTDGISDAKFGTDANLKRQAAWDALWQDLQSEGVDFNSKHAAEQLLAWLDFWVKGEYDDRTIAILY